MAIYRLQCGWQYDTAFPRDRMYINPVFNESGGIFIADDVDNLCEDLATALAAWQSGTGELTVKAYDVRSAPPNVPLGSAIRNVGAVGTSASNRETAVCLSFYSGQNTPSRRGRLYIPAVLTGLGSAALRPAGAIRQKIDDLVPIFTGLGGTNVDWSVYSKKNDEANAVSNWWIDDEWDVVRSRGLRATTRDVGTVTE